MAAQAVRQWQQVASYINGLADSSGSLQWLSSTQIEAFSNLFTTYQTHPTAPRAVWKKLLQQQVIGRISHHQAEYS
jgi:hypothetical protein